MKKILAVMIAVTAAICTFTGCGDNSAEKEGEKSNSVVTTAEKEEKETKADDAEKETKEDKKSKKDDKESDKKEKKDDKKNGGSYEDALNEYFDAMNDGDFIKVLEMGMPEGGLDAMKLSLMAQAQAMGEDTDVDAMLDEYAKTMQGDVSNIRLSKIVSAEDLSEDETESLKEACAAYKILVDYIKEKGGIDKIDLEKMEEEFEELDPEDFAGQITVDDAKYLTVEYTEDGEDEPQKEEMYVYRINGGDWRVDNSMMVYVRKSKQASANSAANSLSKAMNSALVDLDEEGGFTSSEPMLVSSDASKNIGVPPDFDIKGLGEKVDDFFEGNKELDWFVVLDKGCAVSAVVKKDKSLVGLYPLNSILNSELSAVSDDDVSSKSYDELYDMCAEILK